MSKYKILNYNKRPNNFKGPLKYKPIRLLIAKAIIQGSFHILLTKNDIP